MNRLRDPDEIIAAWLDDGPNDLSESTRRAIVTGVRALPRRRPGPFYGGTPMPGFTRLAVAALVISLTAISLAVVVPGGREPGPGVAISPSPTTTASPRPSLRDGQAVGNGLLIAGRYHIDVQLYNYLIIYDAQPSTEPPGPAGRPPTPGGTARVSFDLPDGWTGSGWAIKKHDADPPGGLSMAPVTMDRVYLDPCNWVQGDLADPSLMQKLEPLAEALSAWWDGDPSGDRFAPTSPTATVPTNVSIAGLEGRYVELLTPPDIDLASCDLGQYRLWAQGRGQRNVQGPGQLDRLWIVDADGVEDFRDLPIEGGGLLVIDAASQPGASPEDLAELQAIVDSMEISFIAR